MKRSAAILVLLLTPAARAAITISPYLQTPMPESIYVCWQTDAGTESTVQYGLTAGLGSESSGDTYAFDSSTLWHCVKLSGLSPDTAYFYRCITGTSETAVSRFRTPPADGAVSTHVRFGIIGDNQYNSSGRFDTTIARMKAKMAELFGAPLEDSVNVIMSVGDIVGEGGGDLYGNFEPEYLDPASALAGNVPFMIATGGHEGNPDTDYTNLYRYVKYEDIGGPDGEYYYAFQIARVLFVVLNYPFTYDLPDLIQNQPAWLHQVLEDAEADSSLDWVFLFYHSPYISELWPPVTPSDFYTETLMPEAESHPKVALFASGHTHGYERNQDPDYPIYRITSGGAAGGLDRWGMYANQDDLAEVQKAYDHYNYVVVDVDCAAKSMNAWMFSQGTPEDPRNNDLLDSFYLKRADFSPPDQPTGFSSAGFLNASAYAGAEPLQSSHFQVTSSRGDYSSPDYDVRRDHEDIYQDVDQNQGIDLSRLAVTLNGEYWWRVRYRDQNLQWSPWSEEINYGDTIRPKAPTGLAAAVVP